MSFLGRALEKLVRGAARLSGVRQLARGATTNVAASMLRAAARGAWSLLVPIVLPTHAFGQYSLFQASSSAVAQVATLGAPQAVMREGNRDIPYGGLVLHGLLIVVLASSLLAVSVLHETWPFHVLVAGTAALLMVQGLLAARVKRGLVFEAVLQGETWSGVILFCGGLYFAIRAASCGTECVNFFGVGVVEAGAVAAGVVVLSVCGRWSIRANEARTVGLKRILPSVYSVGALVLLDVLIWRRTEMYFLQASPDGVQGVAVFGLATQLAGIFLLVPAAIIDAWFPQIAGMFREPARPDSSEIQTHWRVYNRVFAAILLACVLLTPLAVRLVFGRYWQWWGYVYLFVVTRVTCGYAGFCSSILYACNREKLLYLPITIGALLALITNATMTLRWGLRGAVVAHAVTQLAVAVLTLFVYRRGMQPLFAPRV